MKFVLGIALWLSLTSSGRENVGEYAPVAESNLQFFSGVKISSGALLSQT